MYKQESCTSTKMTTQCALYMGALKIFLDMPTLYFVLAFIRIGRINVPAKFEFRSFTCSLIKRGQLSANPQS